MSAFYDNPKSESEMIPLIHHAIASGITHLEASLKRLDVDYIDLYYVRRIDTRVPICPLY